MALRQRLLRDIAELQTKPYPNVHYIPRDSDITQACLLLTPTGSDPIHLTVRLPATYPLQPPSITVQSMVEHPNVFGSYICASILNTQEGYTPAYDLKGIAIQILSFFSSDKLEQEYGNPAENLTIFRSLNTNNRTWAGLPPCQSCGFNGAAPSQVLTRIISQQAAAPTSSDNEAIDTTTQMPSKADVIMQDSEGEKPKDIMSMPDEILSLICDALETEELMVFARSWNRIGSTGGIVTKFNLIRNRELLCFCLKKGTEDSKLGVGISMDIRSRQGSLSSEFDLLSLQAFGEFSIRRSVHGLPFNYWLPLPLSRKHYNSIKSEVIPRLETIRLTANIAGGRPVDAIFAFMNDIVVKLSAEAQDLGRSALDRASEKAIESYFHLFHLLLCQVTGDDSIVRSTNRMLQDVLDGRSSKTDVPNLGHLLISVLISDADMTKDLLMAIIRETVTRNVVWMLDKKGSGMPELAYMEADPISAYRLRKTFEASKTSYRLLMFLNLFRQTINRGEGAARKSLVQMRDKLFDAHGAPPRGTAAKLANDIKTLQQVDSFPKFIQIMGLVPPTAGQFTVFLRNCMEESVRKGYSVWGISQDRALTLRRQVDPDVQVNTEPKKEWIGGGTFEVSFFPNRDRGGGGRGGGRGGRGGGRGRGRGGRG